MFVVIQVLRKPRVRERATEPSAPPEKKRHQNDQPRHEKEEQAIAGGHSRARSRRAHRGIRDNSNVCRLRSQWMACLCCWGRLRGGSLAFAEQAVIAQLEEHIEEENASNGQKNQAHEQTVNA